MVKINSDEQYFREIEKEIKDAREVTKARRDLLKGIQKGYENGNNPFNPKYLIITIESMNEMLGELSIFTLMVTKAFVQYMGRGSNKENSNRDGNIELLNSLVAELNDQKVEVKEFLGLVKTYFRNVEEMK